MSLYQGEYTAVRTLTDDGVRLGVQSSSSSSSSMHRSASLKRMSSVRGVFAAGTIFSSVVNVCSATLGVGALALPFAISQCGVIPGVILIFLAAASSVYSIHLLLSLHGETGRESFEEVAFEAFGWWGELATQITMLVFCFGGAVGCIMVVGDILRPIVIILLPSIELLHHRVVLQFLLVTLVMLPLSFYERISELRMMSLTACCGVLILTAVITFQGVESLVQGDALVSDLVWFKLDEGLLTSVPIILFGYICQTNIFSIYTEMVHRTPDTMYRAVNIAIVIETALYLLIGLFGYAMFEHQHVRGNILDNMSIRDPLSALAQGCIGVAIVLTFPLNIYPARFTLHTLFDNTADGAEPPSATRSVIYTLSLVYGGLMVAVVVPSISQLFSFLGATTGSLIGFIMPGAFYLKLIPADHGMANTRLHRALCWLMVTGGGVLATVTTVRSIQTFVQGEPEGR